MFGSGWGQNNQQNQQQQQQPTAGGFGQPAQPSAFGTTGFGQPSAFGAAQPQSTFGTTNNTASTGFGGFGTQPKPTFGATGGIFGQPAASTSTASTGFGGFGASTGTTAASTTGGFGGSTTGGLFGKPAGTTPAATSAFGGTAGFGGTGSINGTASPAYQVTSEKEGTSLGMTNYQAITCMPPYKGFSFEELRLQDYAAGRKTATSTGFGGTSAFGATAAPTATTTAFGQPAAATTTFGQPAAATTGGFGSAAATTGAFGHPAQQPASTGFGGFGQTNATTGGGLFGQNTQQQQQQPQQQPATTGFGTTTGGFGAAGGLFGQQQQQPPQQQQQPATGGLFGASGTTTGAFGSTAPKPAFGGFGTGTTTAQPATTGFGFGQNTATTGTTGGLFGQNPQQQQQQQQPAQTGFGGFGTTNATQPATGGLFGNTAQPATQPANTGLFGQTQQQQQPAAGGFGTGTTGFGTGGLFGQQQQQQPQQQQQQPATGGLFGQPAAQQTQPATGGLFGNAFGQNTQQQQQPQQQQTGGLFGGTGLFAPKPTAPATGGLFGNPQAQTAPAAGTGLFGQSAQPAQNAGGLFGNFGGATAGQQQPAQQATGLFGAPKPAGTTGLFGSTAGGATGGLFGSTTAAPVAQATGGLFGSQAPAVAGSVLGQSQQPLIASLDGNIYNTNPLLSASAKADASHIITLGDRDKRPALAYTKKPLPKVTTPKLGPLRGFSTPPPGGLGSSTGLDLSIGMGASPFRPMSAQGSRIGMALGGLSDSTSSSPGKGLTPDAFKPRSSVKKLILPNKVDPLNWNETLEAASHTLQSELGVSSPSMGTAPLGTPGGRTKVTWDPQLGRAARENALASSTSRPSVASPKLFGGQTLTSSQFGPNRRFSGPSPSVSTSRLPESTEVTPSKTPVSALKNKNAYTPSKEPGEYWTEPSMHELRDMSVEELRQLSGFKVHRNGFGHIEFLDHVDLTTVKNVEDIPGNYIVFDAKECTVYPDESEKPDQGEGMNVRARISLVQCWPVEKATQQPITDPKHPKILQHVKKLKGIQDTTFKSYDAPTGTWVFEVPHFTRYGLDDEDDEEEEEEVEMVVPLESTTPTGTPSKSIPAPEPSPGFLSESARSEEMAVDEGEREHERASSDVLHSEEEYETEEEHPAPPPVSRPWASTLGLDPQRVNVMQASFFHTAPEEVAQPPSRLRAFASEGWKGSNFGEDVQSRRQIGTMGVSQAAQAQPLPKPVQPILAPPVVTPLREVKLGEYKKSVAFGADGSFVDAGLSLARSFRVGWGPNGLLAHCGTLCGLATPNVHASSTVTVERMPVLSANLDVEISRTAKLFDVQLTTTDIDVDDDGIPVAIPRADIRFAHYCKMFESEDRSMEASLWRLGAALFDQIDIQLKDDVSWDIRKTVEALRYKTSLSDWLEKTVEPAVKRDLVLQDHGSAARRAFTMLTGHQVEQAADTAINAGDLNLATLISQAGGDDVFKGYLVTQLDQWKAGGMDSFMDSAYWNVVALLAGLHQPAETSLGSRSSTGSNLFANLDWKRVFGLHLWYGTSLEDTAEGALEQARSTGAGLKPRPWYEEEPPKSQVLWNVASADDGLFQLIRLPMEPSLQLDVALDPRGFSPSPLDYRLPWHLYILLATVLRQRDFGDRAEIGRGNMEEEDGMDNAPLGTSVLAQSVTLNYASQLEYIGEKEKALFVLLHLEQAEGRAIAVKQLLARHAGDWDVDLLTAQLCVPATWIAEANGIRARYDNDVFQAYQCFLEGGQQQLAHTIALNELAPEVVIRGDTEVLKSLFGNFTPSDISGWHDTGNLYLQYAECVTKIPKLLETLAQERNAEPDVVQQAELERLAQAVPHLLENLPKMFEHRDDLRQRVCLAEMLSQLLRLVSPLRMYGITARPHISSGMLPEQARLQHVQSSSRERLFRALEIASSA